MRGERLTTVQCRALRVLAENPGGAAGFLAERAGYAGKTGSPYGGAGRAPMWWGRIMANLPPGLVRRYVDGRSTRYVLTEAGRRALEEAETMKKEPT